MRRQSDYWSAWMAGWVTATRTLLSAQQRALEMFLPQQPPRQTPLEAVPPATAGDKPLTSRRRGRPPKAAEAAPKRRRGRPPKASRSRS